MSITDGKIPQGIPPQIEGILDAIREGAERVDKALGESGYEHATATPLRVAVDEALEAIAAENGEDRG